MHRYFKLPALLWCSLAIYAAAEEPSPFDEIAACRSLPNAAERLACYDAIPLPGAKVAGVPSENRTRSLPVAPESAAPPTSTATSPTPAAKPNALAPELHKQIDDIASEKARLAAERERLEAERRALAEERARLAEAKPEKAPKSTGESIADFGAEQVRPEHKAEKDKTRIETIIARITKARQGPDKRWILTLDNGQVWRQVEVTPAYFDLSAGPLEVRITRSFIKSSGYYLTTEKSNRRLFIQRIK